MSTVVMQPGGLGGGAVPKAHLRKLMLDNRIQLLTLFQHLSLPSGYQCLDPHPSAMEWGGLVNERTPL